MTIQDQVSDALKRSLACTFVSGRNISFFFARLFSQGIPSLSFSYIAVVTRAKTEKFPIFNVASVKYHNNSFQQSALRMGCFLLESGHCDRVSGVVYIVFWRAIPLPHLS